MNIYDGVLHFRGTWRTYQKRVLDHTERYLADGKVHIVAAPGSGKTTLGIELIRRLGKPCLILSPSITIRQQWIARIEEGFLVEGQNAYALLSNDMREAKPITAITYQALHSCVKRYKGVLKDDESEDAQEQVDEVVDYSGFDIYAAVKEAGIKTICLDEAHHLRSEWWRALEEFLKKMPDVTLISLTATPPYDSTPAQWKRYIDLCGPIDEEIFTPELVREGSLCPHQDYVYLSCPTKEEMDVVKAYVERAEELLEELRHDSEFARMIAAHRGILSPMEYSEEFLEHPKYFSSILIFLHDAGIPFSDYLIDLTGTKGRFPKLDREWMEVLLQGFLYDDVEAYPCDKVSREEMIAKFKAAGCIRRNKVMLTKNGEVTKLLISSKGKLNSINDIVRAEYESLGGELRLLVLCDYIKKEMLSLIGDEEKAADEIGAVPIFETIRRQNIPGIRLGVLSGSVVIVPADVQRELEGLLLEYSCEGSMMLLKNTGYSKVTVKGGNNHIVAAITELFARGRIHVLVGTKSLLGEGWDSPCINSLILATYVGSFMLSNQMRGRAIRVFREQPDKTSNIWHLACVFPPKEIGAKMVDKETLFEDYETLVRRFEAFLGVSYQENVIESGIERLGIAGAIQSRRDIEASNKKMLSKARDRKGLRKLWTKSLKVIYDDMTVEEVQEVDKAIVDPGYIFWNAVILEIVFMVLLVMFVLLRLFVYATLENVFLPGIFISAGLLVCTILVSKYGLKIASLCTPQKRMRKVAEGILDALIQTGKIEEPLHCRVVIEETEIAVFSYLKGGNTRDKTQFAACMAEFWGVIDNPRYLLTRKKRRRWMNEYYAVPEVLGRRKEDAEIFGRCMKRALGPYEAVYTRTPEGRRLLLKARTRSFVNKNDRLIRGKKQVKGEFE